MNISIAPHILRHYRRIQHTLERLDPAKAPWATISPGSQAPRANSLVFPGSFNPPTLAHLAMLRQARAWITQRHGGHWQIYAALSRHIVDKETTARMTLLDRVALLERLLTGHTGVLLLNRGLYVEQAQGIRAAFPQIRRLYFLLGFDKIVQIIDMRYYADRDAALRELFTLAELLVAPRGADGKNQLNALLARPENRPFVSYIHALPLDARYREMSSTSARQGVRLSDVPAEVGDFIQRTRPYASPACLSDGTACDVYARRTRALHALLATGSSDGTSSDWSRSGQHRPLPDDSE
jgi:nicotinic acid mononucleotide adenylyltransferase